MTSHEVTCITLNGRPNIQERITHVGGQDPRGRLWRLTVGEAIQGIMEGKWEFFVNVDGTRQMLKIAYSQNGYRFLKAQGDAEEPTTLLGLSECGN